MGTTATHPTETRAPKTQAITLPPGIDQVVLVLQGGGALGAYQVGVYQALSEAGIEPDWVIGTSIGAINASLITGNDPAARIGQLCEFWARVTHGPLQCALGGQPFFGTLAATWATLAAGIPAFFRPNPLAFANAHIRLGPEAAGFYTTAPLRRTLSKLVDFDRINNGGTRLTVGAANVRTSEMCYFDSRAMPLDLRHVLASGALPPAFPAIRLDDGELYWDGGILSNTPVEAVFEDVPRRNSLIFVVHIWNPAGPEPGTIWHVLNRQKDIQYSSRTITHIARQKQLHRLRHVVSELVKRMPPDLRETAEVKDLAEYGCLTRMHVVRLMAPPLEDEDHTKDIDFSPSGIRKRWEAGYADTRGVLAMAPWEGEFNPIEGFILHEACAGTGVRSS